MKNLGTSSLSLLAALVGVGGCVLGDYEPPSPQSTGGEGGAGQGGAGQGGAGQGGAGQGGSGGAGQGGSGGMVGPCMPKQEETCFGAPTAFLDVGSCHAGIRVCGEASTWGPCDKQVLPVLTDCKAGVDGDCDGRPACSGDPLDVRVYSVTDLDDSVFGVAASRSANSPFTDIVYAAGISQAHKDAAGGLDGGKALLVQKRGPDIADWTDKLEAMGLGSYVYATDVATLPGESADVAVVGNFAGTSLRVIDTELVNPGGPAGFLAVFHADGSYKFAKLLGSPVGVLPRAVATDAAGNIYVTGEFAGVASFGATVVTANGLSDGFVVSYSSMGAFRWQEFVTGSGRQSVSAIAVTSDGVFIGGGFDTECKFPGTNAISQGETDVFIAHLSPDGNWLWGNAAGGPGIDSLGGVAARPNGPVAMTGSFHGSISADGFSIQSVDPPGPNGDMFVASIDLASGKFASAFGGFGPGDQVARAITFDPIGDLIIAGSFSGSLSLGNTQISTTSEDDTDAFIVKVDAKPEVMWIKQFGDTKQQAAAALDATPTFGHPVLGGGFQSQLLHALSEPISKGGVDAFVLELAP